MPNNIMHEFASTINILQKTNIRTYLTPTFAYILLELLFCGAIHLCIIHLDELNVLKCVLVKHTLPKHKEQP